MAFSLQANKRKAINAVCLKYKFKSGEIYSGYIHKFFDLWDLSCVHRGCPQNMSQNQNNACTVSVTLNNYDEKRNEKQKINLFSIK